MSQKQGSSALSRAARGVPIPSLEEAGRELRQGAGERPCAPCEPPSAPSSGCGHLPTFHRPDFPGMEFLQTFFSSHSHIKQSPVKTPTALVPVSDFSPLEFPHGHIELLFNVMCRWAKCDTCHHCLSVRQILNKTRFNWTKKQVQKMPNKTQSSCFAVNTDELSCYVRES